MNLKNETGAAMAASRSAYEAKVGVEAVLRSGGKNPQLKGVVHEILYRDAHHETGQSGKRCERNPQ